jgi:hypothetical protein
MAQRDTIENRVYLFDSLAGQFVAAAADRLCSDREEERARALRALADLAWVSCVVADTGALDPEAVRERLLAAPSSARPAPSKRRRAAR